MSTQLNHIKQTNKIILQSITIIIIAIITGKFFDVLKGAISPVSFASFILVSFILEIYLYILNKNKDNNTKIKYNAYIGFFLLYTYALFTSTKVLVFIYIFPILYLYSIYSDTKIMKNISISIISINIIRIIWLLAFVGITDKSSITDYTIQFLAILIVCWSAVMATKLTDKFNTDNLIEIKESNLTQERILNEVLDICNLLDNNSNNMYTIVSNLESSSKIMNNNINNMNNSIENTTNNIDTQINLTKNIHTTIVNAVDTATELKNISKLAIDEMNKGVTLVEKLSDTRTNINKNSELLHSSMLKLKNKTDEISTITSTITAIANQTNILSLNASIESARAGEAGKGFSVVANEVSNLASQTNNSASDISQIISELQEVVNTSINIIKDFEIANINQDKLIGNTHNIFKTTTSNINKVNTEVSDVSNKINSILTSNNQIIDSINCIAHSNDFSKEAISETNSAADKTLLHIDETKKIAKELLDTSEKLKTYL